MIFTYFGIILFITYEWVQFISKSSVKQDNAYNNVESQETLSRESGPKVALKCGSC